MSSAAASGSPAFHGRERPNPFGRVLALGGRESRLGLVVGLLGALLLHGSVAARGMTALFAVGDFAEQVRAVVTDKLRTTYDIEVEQPELEPPPPEPEPEPEPAAEPEPAPAPEPPPEPARATAPSAPPPPAAAEAGKVLTAEPDPNEPLDLTDQGFISGNGDRFAGGTTAAAGTSKTAVRDPNARAGGTPTGTGTAPAPAPPQAPAVNKSRPARPASGSWDDCGFPAEADMEQIDFARVTLVVTVGPEGSAKSVSVLSDPGYGFGRLARQCAFRKTYSPGLDRSGRAATTTTPPITVRFTR